ncbi:MAG: hypothetical protein E3J35_05120 [Methanomassiliicoccales archaeon]|nr:MAG: hypothetical protein E3J35_05120 [Methanomassiliicoccales archaeon]
MRDRKLARKVSHFLIVLVVLQSMLVAFSVQPVSGQEPVIQDIGGGRRTATWTLDDPGNYTLEDVTFEGGGANLTLNNFTWYESQQSDFLDGAWDSNVTITPDGNLTLTADDTSLVSNGDFSTDLNWTFSGTGNNVTAERDPALQDAHLHYYGEAGPFYIFDNMDDSTANWSDVGNASTVTPINNSSDCCGGGGSLQVGWKPWPSYEWGGIRRMAPASWDWSMYNRLSVWFYTNYTGNDLDVYLNIVDINTFSWDTPRKKVSGGWNQSVFDLEGFLGDDTQVKRIDIRFTGLGGDGIQQLNVSVDLIELYHVKILNETASASQIFYKANTTENTPGSVILSYDVLIEERMNVIDSNLSLTVTNATSNEYRWEKHTVVPPYSSHISVDLSWLMVEAGSYNISLQLHLLVNTTMESNYSVRFDNITILAPSRKNGTYFSEPYNTTSQSIWREINWVEDVVPETNVTVKTRTGNSSNTSDGTWSGWEPPNGSMVASPSHRFIQYRVDLNTTNASVGPVVSEMKIDCEQYAPYGTVTTENFTVSDLYIWEDFFVKDSTTAETSVTYYYSSDRGGSWSQVFNGSSLSFVANDTLKFRAELSSLNTTHTPYLYEMNLTYQYVGNLDHIHMSESFVSVPAGTVVYLSAWGHDAFHHNVSFQQKWETTDPLNMINMSGEYTAGRVGSWKVYCNKSDDSISNWTVINVSAGTLVRIGIDPWDPGTLTADDQLQFNATGYDVMNNTIVISPNWSVSGGIGTVDPGPSGISNLTAASVGTGQVRIDDGPYQNSTNTIRVVPGARSRIEIEPQQPGVLTADDVMQFNASAYDSDDNLIGPVDATWSVIGGIGVMPPGPSTSSLFNATEVGQGRVLAEYGIHTNQTELFNVVAGQLDSITVIPNPANVFPGASKNFTANGSDSDGNDVVLISTVWETDAGTINSHNSTNASFTAQSTEFQGGYIRATEGSVSGEAVINIDNDDEPPWIEGVIPDQLKPEDFGSWTLDLTDYANDSEDSLSLLRWHIDGDNSSLYTVTGDDKPGNHVLTFITVRDAFGEDEITLSLIDRFDQSTQQSLWVNITPVNDRPTIRDAPNKVYVKYDNPLDIDYAPFIEDVDNSTQDLTLTTDDPVHATVQGLQVTYEYPQNMVGKSIFVVLTVSDGIDQALDVVQIFVSGNYPPRIQNQIADITMNEDEQLLNEFDLDDYFEDPDDDVLTYDSISNKIGINIDSAGLVSLTPEQNWFGEELVIFTATDSAGSVAQDAVLARVLPVNDAPVIEGLPDIVIRYNETFDFDVTPYISDVDDPISDLRINCNDTDNTTILGQTISFFYPSETELEVTVTVKDKKNAEASDVMRVNVTDNRPPVSKGLPNVVMYEDTPLLLAFGLDEYFYDPDDGNLTYTFHQTLYYVEVELNATNWVNFTPAADWSGQEVIVFRAMDDENAIVEDTVVVTVLPVNDAPVFLPVPKQVGEIGRPWLLDLSLYVYDPDNATEDLVFQVDSEYVTVVGRYVIFICNESFSLEIADATVSDGLLQDSQQIEISISSLVAPEVNVFIWPASIGIVLLGMFGLVYWRATRRYSMEDLFLVGKEGKLIVHKTKRARPDRDEDILAGMLTAVQEFAKDVFREEKESLKAFELQQKRIVIETARNFYVAAIFAGKEPKRASRSLEAFVEDVDIRYGSMIKAWSGDMGELEDLPEMVDYFVNVRKYEVGDWKED